jgi:hypothetical protein
MKTEAEILDIARALEASGECIFRSYVWDAVRGVAARAEYLRQLWLAEDEAGRFSLEEMAEALDEDLEEYLDDGRARRREFYEIMPG